MTAIPQDNMEAIQAYLMLEGFQGKQLYQDGEVLAIVDQILADEGFTTQFTNDTMFGKTALQNLYTQHKNDALGGRFGGRSVTYPYGYSMVRRGEATDNDGFRTPVRNKKRNHWDAISGRAIPQILNLARTGELTPEFQTELNAGRDASMASGDSAPAATSTDTTVPETVDEVPAAVAPAPAVAAPGNKIKGGLTEGSQFTVPAPPTPDEQIGLSAKAWQETPGSEKLYDYQGRLVFRMRPSRMDESMQPTNAVVVSETATSEESFDDFMDFGMDDASTTTTTTESSVDNNTPYFLTPELEFAFKMGEKAYFRVVGGSNASEYSGMMWPVNIANDSEGATVTDIKVRWKAPTGTFTEPDEPENFVITLQQAGTTMTLTLDDMGHLSGPEYNKKQSSGQYNDVGGMMTQIASGKVIVYSHPIKGFGGLLTASDGEPTDTMTWSDLNASAAGYTGSVKVNSATEVVTVFQRQMSRFYGNSSLSDARLNWRNWSDSGDPDSIMLPIAGGDNAIFNLDPKPYALQADVRVYEEFAPQYLAPKLLQLDVVLENGVPQATDSTGVIVPVREYDEDGDIEDEEWVQTVQFQVNGSESSEYFGSAQTKTFVLPGDEAHLRFKNMAGDWVDVPKGGIDYITYDRSSAETVGDVTVVRGLRIVTTTGEQIDIPTVQDTGAVQLEDPNGKQVGGIIKGGELSPPAPEIEVLNESANTVWDERRKARRREKQSSRFTKRDETGAVNTRSIAFRAAPSSKEYYVLAETNEGFHLVKIDLDVRRD
jgi:hypothetical protein